MRCRCRGVLLANFYHLDSGDEVATDRRANYRKSISLRVTDEVDQELRSTLRSRHKS